VRTTEDLIALTRHVVTRHVKLAERGRIALRVPKLRGLMQRAPDMPMHSHPEMFFQLSGYTRFSFPADGFRIERDQLCLVPRGMPHGEQVGARQGPFYNLVFMYVRPTLRFHLAGDDGRGRPTILVGTGVQSALMPRPINYVDDLSEMYHVSGAPRDSVVRGLLLAHLSSLLLLLDGASAPARIESVKVAHARDYVQNHLIDPELGVGKIARTIGCSADYLSWLFHKETGSHLNGFITEQRLREARYLLTESTLSVKEVAAATGYADAGYFARVFRRRTGQTPRDYRLVLRHAE
jgi:AraC-like DNA-binding protein